VSARLRVFLKWSLIGAAALVGLVVAALGGALAFGGPTTPPPLTSVIEAVRQRDRGDLPPLQHFAARDGTQLAYRAYPATGGKGAVILIHGSVGSSADVHEAAKAFRDAGITVYAPDIRGHGGSGARGDIAYIGQLEDDLSDFLDHLDGQGAPARRVLIGHSAGGGFALRVAAFPLSARFVGAILMAPFLGVDAPTTRPGGSGWVGVGVPRLIALTVLNRFGVHAFNGLRVFAFALPPEARPYVTPDYSFRLLVNFAPHHDWRRDLASVRRPLIVIVGAADQLFNVDGYKEALSAAPNARLVILPGIDHMSLEFDPSALAAITGAASELLGNGR
jgi:alpha-beta hydrolase superfamily lysophospholipase